MLSNFQLRSVSFSEVSIVVCEKGTLEGEAKFTHSLKVGLLDAEKHLWSIGMCLELEENAKKPFTYAGKLRLAGILQVHPNYPKEKIKDTVSITGASLLYGVAREMVSNITSRSEKGHLMLPTLNFQLILAEAKAKQKAKAESGKTKTLPDKV